MRNTSLIVVSVVVVLLVLLFGGMWLMGFGSNGMMGRFGMTGFGLSPFGTMGSGLNPFGMAVPILLWALIVGGVVLLVARLARGAEHSPAGGILQVSPTATPDSPLDILKLRHAKGEISKEQFEEARRTLGV